jgi:hypothetical protein
LIGARTPRSKAQHAHLSATSRRPAFNDFVFYLQHFQRMIVKS